MVIWRFWKKWRNGTFGAGGGDLSLLRRPDGEEDACYCCLVWVFLSFFFLPWYCTLCVALNVFLSSSSLWYLLLLLSLYTFNALWWEILKAWCCLGQAIVGTIILTSFSIDTFTSSFLILVRFMELVYDELWGLGHIVMVWFFWLCLDNGYWFYGWYWFLCYDVLVWTVGIFCGIGLMAQSS